MFLAWQLAVGGKLKSDPRFANTLVWNTFPMPELSDTAKHKIADYGRDILKVREQLRRVGLFSPYTLARECLPSFVRRIEN